MAREPQMLQRKKSLIFIAIITSLAAILSIGVNVYSFIAFDILEPFSALLCFGGVLASVLLIREKRIGKQLVTVFWLCQTFVVGWSGTKLGFSFALAISVHFNITPESYVVINLIGVVMAVLCFLKLNKSVVKTQTVKA
jgi:hypothetical protein